MEKLIYDTFSALDPTGRNTAHYKQMFSGMTDAQFDKFFKDFFASSSKSSSYSFPYNMFK